jgi:XXXCH domain-containing protein
MKFEEKKEMKKKEIVDLFKGLGELIEEEKMTIGDLSIPFPDSAEVEVEYKEKKGTAKFEVEIQWQAGEAKVEVSKKEKPSLEEVSKEEPSLSEVKKSIKECFNSIRSNVESGSVPSERVVSNFFALNESFKEIAKGGAYEEDAEPYIILVRKLNDAVKVGNLEELRSLVADLRNAKKACHKTYRWKEA